MLPCLITLSISYAMLFFFRLPTSFNRRASLPPCYPLRVRYPLSFLFLLLPAFTMHLCLLKKNSPCCVCPPSQLPRLAAPHNTAVSVTLYSFFPSFYQPLPCTSACQTALSVTSLSSLLPPSSLHPLPHPAGQCVNIQPAASAPSALSQRCVFLYLSSCPAPLLRGIEVCYVLCGLSVSGKERLFSCDFGTQRG